MIPTSEESSTNSGAAASFAEALQDLRPLAVGHAALAQLVALDPRLRRDEALRELGLGHLQREQRDRKAVVDRRVLGDVRDERAVVDDEVVGDEVVMHRDGEVERLLLAGRLDRDDLVPPDVGGREVVELLVAAPVRDLLQLAARQTACPRMPVVVRADVPAARLTSLQGRSPLTASTRSQIATGNVSTFVPRVALPSARERTRGLRRLAADIDEAQKRSRPSWPVIRTSRATCRSPRRPHA